MGDEFNYLKEDAEPETSGRKGRQSPGQISPREGKTTKKSAPIQPPPVFPPMEARRLRELSRNLTHLFFSSLAILAVMGVIYWDYKQTTRYQMAKVQHYRCTQAMESRQVDHSLRKIMGIEEPPPVDMDDLMLNIRLCQAWREELEYLRPFGGWSRELVVEHLKTRGVLLEAIEETAPP